MQSTTEAEEWDESRVLAALSRLQNMHIQLRNLRETIPCLIQPMHASHTSPTAFYQAMSKSATTAVKNIQTFQAIMRDAKSKDVLQRAKESQERNPEGIRGWMVTEHADWLETRAEDDVKELRIREKSVGEEQMRVEEMRVAVEKFNKGQAGVKAVVEGERTLKMTLPPPTAIDFSITQHPETQNGISYAITCKQNSKLHASILDSINSSTKGKGLDYILELLASYSSLRSRPCDKCQRALDTHGQYPVVRTQKNERVGGQEQRQWSALHTGCR